MGHLTPQGLKARELSLKYPSASDLGIAKIFLKEYPNLVKSENQARQLIRYHRGKSKDGARRFTKSPIFSNSVFTRENPLGRGLTKHTKILILDIETAPMLGYVWGCWEQNLSYEQIVSDWFILTWSAKWLFEKKVYSAKLNCKEVKSEDDSRIMKSIWEMLNKADIVITHNGDKFDIRKMNTRFLYHNMNPPLPYISIDTLKHNRKQFAHSSNKLDYINKRLDIRRKMPNEGFNLWKRARDGDNSALAEMEKYNVGDVIALEDLYLRIRSWIKPHPNLSLHITDEEAERCPTCMSDDLKNERKNYYTKTARYEMFRCNNCGSIGRHRVSVISKKRSKFIKISL